MKVYIAGSISNNPHYMEQFAEAETKLRIKGYEPINPTRNKGESYKELIDAGLKQLMECDAIYLLPGFEDSKGASLEYHYADIVGIQVLVRI